MNIRGFIFTLCMSLGVLIFVESSAFAQFFGGARNLATTTNDMNENNLPSAEQPTSGQWSEWKPVGRPRNCRSDNDDGGGGDSDSDSFGYNDVNDNGNYDPDTDTHGWNGTTDDDARN